jgi:RimJ/RimL family protein N-acetyltransferase
MEDQMIVKGKKVYLRTVREKDLDWLYEKTCDIELFGPYFPAWVSSESGFRESFRQTGFWTEADGNILICDPASEAILGMMYCFKTVPYWDCLEIGYRLFDPGVSGRGVMTEALSLLNYVLFSVRKINRLELKIYPENIASKRVAVKCGYRLEGVARGANFHHGQYLDMEVYSLLRGEGPKSLAEALAVVQPD